MVSSPDEVTSRERAGAVADAVTSREKGTEITQGKPPSPHKRFPVLSTDTVTCIEQENGHRKLRSAHIERPPWHRASYGLKDAPGTTPLTTLTFKRSGYIRTVVTQWLRGHGESVFMRTEPIILLLQVFLCSAPTPSPASSKKTATGSYEVLTSKDRRGIVLLLD
ncbi:hypothetical protein MRX96_059288 [Rhipicephalus microplus]